MMRDTNRCIGDNSDKLRMNKYVTTACTTCRRKRTKCNGQTPCPSCSGTGDSCVYDYNGRRRRQQQHQQSSDRKPPNRSVVDQTPAGGIADTVYNENEDEKARRAGLESTKFSLVRQKSQKKGEHNSTRPVGGSSAPKLRTLAPARAGLWDRVAASPACEDQTKVVVLPWNNNDRSSTAHHREIYAIKDMQGKFDSKAGGSNNDLDAGRLRLARRRLVPKVVSRSQTCDNMRDRNFAYNRPRRQQQPIQFTWQLERKGYAVPGYTRTFGNLPFSSAIKVNGYPAKIQARQALNLSAPDYLVFPIVDVDESPLGRAFTDFQQLGRRLIAESTFPSQVVDQGPIDVTLYFRERTDTDPVNASTWASEMLRAFRGTFSDQLLLACAVCVGSLTRWFLMPTPANYSNIPAIARPTQLQRIKPHPSWVDLMIFPTFRDALINELRDWVGPCIKARWEFLWPRSLEEALVRHADTQRIYLSPTFVAYTNDPQNWPMQRSILEDFPEVQGSEMSILQE